MGINFETQCWGKKQKDDPRPPQTCALSVNCGTVPCRSYIFNFIEMEVDSHPQPKDNYHPDDHYLVMHDKTLKCVCELCTCGNYLQQLRQAPLPKT